MLAAAAESTCLAGYLGTTGASFGSLVRTRDLPEDRVPRSRSSFVFREVAAAGCVSSWVSCLFNFTDVAKVRMQAAGSGTVAGASLRQTCAGILHAEGLWALLSPGIVASCLRDLSYSGLSIGMYPFVKDALFGGAEEDIGVGRKFLTGVVTGGLFSGIVNPTDLVKIRTAQAPLCPLLSSLQSRRAAAQVCRRRPGGSGRTACWRRVSARGAAHATPTPSTRSASWGERRRTPPLASSSQLQLVCSSHRWRCAVQGLAGLFRGSSATVARAACGRGAQ